MFDYQDRMTLLRGAFIVERDAVAGKRILLVDDLYRSGAKKGFQNLRSTDDVIESLSNYDRAIGSP